MDVTVTFLRGLAYMGTTPHKAEGGDMGDKASESATWLADRAGLYEPVTRTAWIKACLEIIESARREPRCALCGEPEENWCPKRLARGNECFRNERRAKL
jgi:hypothetical protein